MKKLDVIVNNKILSVYLAVVFIVLMSASLSKKIYYNWDLIPYVAIALSIEGSENIQKGTYDLIERSISRPQFQNLFSSEYRRDMYENENNFLQQLPYYKTKPLYTYSIFLIGKTGVNYVLAITFISIFSYIALSIVIYLWLSEQFKPIYSLVFFIIICSAPPLQNLATLSTPDAFSTALLISSFYLLLEKKRVFIGGLFLVASIYSRMDNVLISTAVFMVYYGYSERKNIPVKITAFFLISSVLSYFLIQNYAEMYPWRIFVEHSVMGRIHSPADHLSTFTLTDYVGIVLHPKNFSSYLACTFLFGISSILFMKIKKVSVIEKTDAVIITLMSLYVCLRWVMLPDLSSRYFTGIMVLFVILGLRVLLAYEPKLSFLKKV